METITKEEIEQGCDRVENFLAELQFGEIDSLMGMELEDLKELIQTMAHEYAGDPSIEGKILAGMMLGWELAAYAKFKEIMDV